MTYLVHRPNVAAQANYEKSVFAKTSRTNARGEGMQLLPSSSQSVIDPLELCHVSQSGQALADSRYAGAAEITMFDDVIVVYKFVSDLMFFVTGSQDENELILATVLQGFCESVSLLLR